MKIYKISQKENNGYDTFDSAVVFAEDEEKARKIHPEGKRYWGKPYPTWCSSPDLVKVEYLGEAKDGAKEGVVLGSFNAG